LAYTILVPIDDTTWNSGFISHLNQLAQLEDSGFVLLRVLPDLTGVNALEIKQRLHEAETLLNDCANQLEISNDHIWFNIEMGIVENVITQRAIIEKVDLIAMTTHARAGVSRILDGSVAESVMRVAPCPTLLFHTDTAPHPEFEQGQKMRILVPIDTNRESSYVLDSISRMVPTQHCEIILYHSYTGTSEADNSGNSIETEKAIVELCKQSFKQRGYKVSNIVSSFRSPASDIIKTIQEQNIDLIAMATNGRSGISRLLFGSIAESILHHSSCPLLAVSTLPTHEVEYRERYIG
jgi:nucleotide-binding universal stress UspA family protein